MAKKKGKISGAKSTETVGSETYKSTDQLHNKENDAIKEVEHNYDKPCPLLTAGWVSKITFWWMNDLFMKGFKRDLTHKDMYQCMPCDLSRALQARVLEAFEKQKPKIGGRGPSLLKGLLKCFGKEFILIGLYLCVVEVIKLSQPVVMGYVIGHFLSGSGNSYRVAWINAGIMMALGFMFFAPQAMYFYLSSCLAMRLRAACSALIFRKTLALSNNSLAKTSSGTVVNLLATDVEKFNFGTMYIHFLWAGPVEVIVVVVLLYRELGVAVLAGLVFVLVLSSLQMIFSNMFGKLRTKIARWTDERILTMNEVISGMRVIKMYGWEGPFANLVNSLRKKEMGMIKKTFHIRGQTQAAYFISSKLVAYVIMTTYALMGNIILAERTFKMVAWLELVRVDLFLFIPLAIQMGTELFSSLRRIQEFLLLDDYDGRKCDDPLSPPGTVTFADLCAVWSTVSEDKGLDNKGLTNYQGQVADKIESSFSLSNVTITINPGELVAVVGSVGCGKTSLLMAILGELEIVNGSVQSSGVKSYTPQEPWMFSGTVRDNILFGLPYLSERYNNVVKNCALLSDFDNMISGDLTTVGERGLSLSGGQKARINLARAVYRDADIYLLDDPLSAVDSKVGKHLFDKCICGYLKNKTRILATHQLQYLKKADKIVVLRNGEVVAFGNYVELQAVNFDDVTKDDDDAQEGIQRRTSTKSGFSTASSYFQGGQVVFKEGDEIEPVSEEELAQGTVKWSTYWQYFRAGKGVIILPILLVFAIAVQVAYTMTDWWLATWSRNNLRFYGNQTTSSIPAPFLLYNIIVYSIVVGLLLFFNVSRSVFFYTMVGYSCQILHDTMFSRLIRAPIGFFEKNPVGRILNRFSRDMGFMDDTLPLAYHEVSFFLLLFIGTMIVCVVVNYWVIIPTVPVVAAMLFLRFFAIRTTRAVKRIEATCRSPVYNQLSSALQGLPIIRAFKMASTIEGTFHNVQDRHSAAWLMYLSSYRWLGVRIDWTVATYLAGVILAAMLLPSSAIDGGLIGLSLSYILALFGVLQYIVRQSAELENLMTSVERILEYTTLEQEVGDAEMTVSPPGGWPRNGAVTFQKMSLYYEADEPALSEISLHVKDKEKIGIVGRTGAGKSSIFVALLRLVEPTGKILIDGVNICKISLKLLRQNISVIPQDPVLFRGSMRRNLDPFSDYQDEDLWRVLEQVELRSKIGDMSGGLYAEVTEGGSNFSVGQRQLVCLARALLRKNHILVIDEATANVDHKTDSLIQKTIREQFRDCTVLTVAHRLNTIIDCDKVLVLDKGKVSQFDHPHVLLQDRKGVFFAMLKHTGKHTAERLASIARHCYLSRLQEKHPHPDGDGLYDNVEDLEEPREEMSRRPLPRSISQSVDTLSVISMDTEDMTIDTTDLEDAVTVHCDVNCE